MVYSVDSVCGWQNRWCCCVVELVVVGSKTVKSSSSLLSNGLGPAPSPGELSQSDELLLLLLRLPPVDNLRLLENPIEIDSLADGLKF